MRKVLFMAIVLLLAGGMQAAVAPGFGTRRYTVGGGVEYSYNTTWGHHANFDIQGLMPFNPHFEMEARLRLSTAKVYTGVVQIRPKFELPVGELFLETDLRYRAVVRNKIGDITAGVAIGYRMDYISITIGSYCRVLDDWTRSWHSTDSYVVEPFNLLYRIEVFCRPQDNNWNLSFLFSDVDEFQMERMWQPLFGIGAWYDIDEHWRLNFAAQCKPTGMFHLDASFYGASGKVGFGYRF